MGRALTDRVSGNMTIDPYGRLKISSYTPKPTEYYTGRQVLSAVRRGALAAGKYTLTAGKTTLRFGWDLLKSLSYIIR